MNWLSNPCLIWPLNIMWSTVMCWILRFRYYIIITLTIATRLLSSLCYQGLRLVWASMGGPVNTRVFLRRLRPAKSLLQDKNIGGIFSFISVNYGRVCMYDTYGTHRSGITDWWWVNLQKKLAAVYLVMNVVVSMHMSDDSPHTWWVLLLVTFLIWPS